MGTPWLRDKRTEDADTIRREQAEATEAEVDVFEAYFATVIDGVAGDRSNDGVRWVGPGCGPIDSVWWIVSAENPMDRRLDDGENLERHRELGRVWPDAIEVVCSAAGWRERSWAVGADWESVLRQAQRFEQRAVFRVTDEWVEVVMTSGGRDGEVIGRRDRAHRAGWVALSGSVIVRAMGS